MSEQEESREPQPPLDTKSRRVGLTEHSWCKAVPGGTGTTVMALHLSKPPDISLLQNAFHHLQTTHPILNSKIHFNPTSGTYSYITPSSPTLHIQPFDRSSTAQILQDFANNLNTNVSLSPLHLILEHELNRNSWHNPDPSLDVDTDVFFASLYTLDDDTWVLALRLHTSACDRTTAREMLRELVVMVGGDVEKEIGMNSEVGLGIEDYIPSGKANKPFWARGVDMLGYTLNFPRLANLEFKDTVSPRSSQVVRLQLNSEDTDRILSGCKSRAIKLCGLLAAAGLIAARSVKSIPNGQWQKYAVVTLMDCRASLDPVLSDHHFGLHSPGLPNDAGFYYSAILNTHDTDGGENLWELANRTYTSFANAKSNNKHFSDMADLNFLMCKAIENPGLTPSSSLRTSLISVFEDPVIDSSKQMHQEIGLLDYIGCASVHGVGTSVAIFDTIRDGQLDCACAYPSPLHSREQMLGLVNEMKRILVNSGN